MRTIIYYNSLNSIVPVMADKFYVVSGMARFDAVDADCVTVCRVAGLAPEIVNEH